MLKRVIAFAAACSLLLNAAAPAARARTQNEKPQARARNDEKPQAQTEGGDGDARRQKSDADGQAQKDDPKSAERARKEEKKRAARWKQLIDQLGAGRDSRVAVVLRDGSELKGYVSERDREGFAVTDDSTGATTRVLYTQVERIPLTPGVVLHGLKREVTGKRLAKNVLITFGVLFVIGAIAIATGHAD